MQQKLRCRNFCCKDMESKSGLRVYFNVSIIPRNDKESKGIDKEKLKEFRLFPLKKLPE